MFEPDVLALGVRHSKGLHPHSISGPNADYRSHPAIKMKLTPEYAQRLFETGAFVIFSDLPAGAEVGIDGWKMIPPGTHLITWSVPSLNQLPSGMPIRHAVLRQLAGQENLVLKYSSEEEDLVPNTTDATTGEEIPTILSQEQLRSLDSELAAYPLYRWSEWKALVSCVQDADIVRLIGPKRKLDSLFESPADDEVVPRGGAVDNKNAETTDRAGLESAHTEGHLSYAPFNLRRSWRKGAVGEEVTIYSKDKSWLLQHIIKEQFGGDCLRLLAQLQLAFVIFINVQNFSSLLAFKRCLGLLARSERIFLQEGLRNEGGLTLESVDDLYVQLLQTLSNQLQSLPDTFFTVDLAGTGLQDFWREELLALSVTLVRGHPGSNPFSAALEEALANLRSVAPARFQWDLGVGHSEIGEDDESLEEGEDAPVIVDLS